MTTMTLRGIDETLAKPLKELFQNQCIILGGLASRLDS